jgi:hypothetical protein
VILNVRPPLFSRGSWAGSALCWSHVRRRFYELAAADPGRRLPARIDSNVVERSIRPIALNRKNTLFAGSGGGGEHWAIIASLIETCKFTGVDPHAYLTDVITKIVNGRPNSRSDELLPCVYPTKQALKDVA